MYMMPTDEKVKQNLAAVALWRIIIRLPTGRAV